MSALSGFKILELCEGVSGEYCGKLLSDFGAEVIKIERPGGGSPTRAMGPFVKSGPEAERSGLFAYLNTNKSSITLDLTTPAGVATLRKLLDRVDVVIDDHPTGWLKSMGMDPYRFQEHWMHLVVCSITPFGQSPPEERTYAEDLNVFHSSGWGYHTPGGSDGSRPPLNGPGRFLPSYEGGLEAAMCIVSALYDREESKLGQFIDISKHQVLATRIDYVLAQMVAGEMDVSTDRKAYDLGGPAGIVPCGDGYAYIWLSSPAHWEGLRKILGNPDWMNDDFPANWLERGTTPERVARCRAHIVEWLKTEDKEEASEKAQKLGLVMVPVNDVRDVLKSPQAIYRKFFAEVTHPVQGKAQYPTAPYQLSKTPVRIKTPAPLLGQHTDEKLAALTGAQIGAATAEKGG